MTGILIFVLVVVVIVMPVKVAAKLCGAQEYGFFRVLFALIVVQVISNLLGAVTANELARFLIGTAVGTVVYSLALVSTWKQGLMISILSNVFGYLIAWATVAALLALGILVI